MAHVRKETEPLTEISDKIVEIIAALHEIEGGTLDGLTAADFVQIAGTQTITGAKDFSITPTVNGNTIFHEGNFDAADVLTLLFTVDGTGSGLDADLLDGLEASAFVQIAGAQTITGAKTFTSSLIIQDDSAGLLQFNNATWGGRVARIFGGSTGNFVFRPTSAADVDAATSDLFYNNTADRWQFETDLVIGGDVFLGGLILTPAISNVDNGATYDQSLARLSISTVDNVSIILNHKDSDVSGVGGIQQFRFNGNTVGSINVDNSSTAYSTTSDERLKANERELGSVLDPRVLLTDPRAAPYRYERTDNRNRPQDGMLAQQLAELVPEVVVPGVGLPEDQDFVPWMIDYGRLTPYLMAICRYQEQRIDALEARLAALEGV